MPSCPSCASEVPEGKRFCADCGVALAPEVTPTRTADPDDHSTTPASLTSAESLDGSRFLPGTVIAQRYRIVALIGRGGMGEVYRADDLKLGRPVALKFLPAALELDEDRRRRLLDEVRVALQVTHPNVCRVYDIGDVDPSTGSGQAHHYLSMEYVDGEDLASLLRRIGRLPRDKAAQIARQLCAGLAAAHEEGILHRDLKPANVLIDGRGRARITDFGLAGLETGFRGADVRAGTPAYMAPEQLTGEAVTSRSDIYALGLVLYELYTGKRAFRATTPAEAVRLQRETPLTSPASLVEGLDPAVERIILRCLEQDPTARPGSALAVAAALPGGDPLAAALAAGETPSPELIAEAGEAGGLKPWLAWSFLLATIAGLLLSIQLVGGFQLGTLLPPGKAPQLLVEKAHEIILELGYDVPPLDSVYGYEANQLYLDHLAETVPSSARREHLAVGQPPALWFWYRQSPRRLTPFHSAWVWAVPDDPPASVPGSLEARLDPQGRLRWLEVVPPERDDSVETAAEPDWAVLFEAAGFEIDEFRAVDSRWLPRVFADRRAAWEGTYPDDLDTAIRVEAAAHRGRPVSFRIFEPWTPLETAEAPAESPTDRLLRRFFNLFVLGTLFGGALVAWRNVRSGRGDRRGAWRLAAYLLCVRMAVWLFGADDRLEPSGMDTFLSHLAWALYRFGVVWLFYIALEPYLRRIWPRSMVSWVRLLDGRFRDPLVGRDVLIGVLAAVVLMVAIPTILLAGEALGWAVPGPSPDASILEALRGLSHAVAMMLFEYDRYLLQAGMYLIVFLLLMRLVLRQTWLAVGVFLLAFAGLRYASGEVGTMVGWSIQAIFIAAWLLLFFRAGLLTLIVCLGTFGLFMPPTLSLDPGAWYASGTYFALLLTLGLAVYGFYVSLAGRPLFRDTILEG